MTGKQWIVGVKNQLHCTQSVYRFLRVTESGLATEASDTRRVN